MFGVELERTARNRSNFEGIFVRTDFCGHGSYSSIDNDNNKVLLSVYTLEIYILEISVSPSIYIHASLHRSYYILYANVVDYASISRPAINRTINSTHQSK